MARPRHAVRNLSIALGLLAAGGVLTLILAGGNGAIPVHTVRLKTGTVEELISATSSGTVEAERSAVLAAELAGRIRAIHVRLGRAAAGTLIVEFDDADLRAERLLTERGLETARLRREQAKLRRERLEADYARWKDTDLPRERLEQTEKEIGIARKDEEISDALLRELEASLAVVDRRLSKTRVLAPSDGLVARLHAEEGEFVTPGRPLFTWLSGPTLVRAPLDEVDMARMPARAEARVHFDGHPGETYDADVIEIQSVASTDEKNNRTVDVKVRVRTLPPDIVPGMSARVEIVAGRAEGARSLPTNVIHDNHDTATRYVFVLAGGAARRREIRTGRWNWETTEVLSGLAETDEVIETGRIARDVALTDGLAVRRVQP